MTVARIILAFLLLGGILVMVADFRLLGVDTGLSVPADSRQLPDGPIGNTYAVHAAARQAGQRWGMDPDGAIELITRSQEIYPLNSRGWMDLARIEASQRGEFSETLAANLQAAVAVRPGIRATRWQAAQIALQAGDTGLAEDHLFHWLRGDPGDTHRALFIVRRWIDDPHELIERMLPEGDEFLSRAMDFAYRQRDQALAEAIWQRAEEHVDLSDPIFLAYVDFLIAQGAHERAIDLWARHDRFYQPGNVANGDFSRPVGESRGLNWQIGRLPTGVRIIRDTDEYFYRPASLRIEFSGDHNLRLREPWIRIPVKPGIRYRLSGHWKADGLTTRSLPFWYVDAENGRIRERVDLPGTQFEWSPWSVTFEVPETSHMIRLQLRRDSTTAFDRYIDGNLWLDGIELTELSIADEEVDA